MFASVLDTFRKPPCSELLGFELIEAKPEEGWIRTRFDAKQDFCNPAGFIQGGFLTAMLDDTMGPAVLIHTNGAAYTVSIDLNVQFLGAAKPGPMFGEAKVVQVGKTIAFVEGWLFDADGRTIARASTSARVVASEKAVAKA
jgi:uncharacterized protein (TIGR00369 family)